MSEYSWTVDSAIYQLTHGTDTNKTDSATKWLQSSIMNGTFLSVGVTATKLVNAISNLRSLQNQAKENEMVEGYTNYPTFAVAQWYKNSRYHQGIFRRAAKINDDIHSLAVYLRAYVEADPLMREEQNHPPYSEFISYGVSSVNWYELAEELHNEVKEEKK